MINYIIPLIYSYFSSGLDTYWFFPFIALCFIATVPVIIRIFFLRRKH